MKHRGNIFATILLCIAATVGALSQVDPMKLQGMTDPDSIKMALAEMFKGPQAIALSPDGKRVAAIVGFKLGLFDTGTRKQLWMTSPNNPPTNLFAGAGLAFSSDGSKIFAVGISGMNEFRFLSFDTESGSVAKTFGEARSVSAMRVSGNNRRLFSEGQTGLTMWDLESGLELRTLKTDPAYGVYGAHLLDDQKTVVRLKSDGGLNSMIEFWDIAAGTMAKSVPVKAGEQLGTSRMGCAGNSLYIPYLLHGIAIIDLNSGSVVRTLETDRPLMLARCQLSTDGKRLLVQDIYGSSLWNTDNGEAKLLTEVPGDMMSNRISLSGNGKTIAFVSALRIGIYDVDKGTTVCWLGDETNASASTQK